MANRLPRIYGDSEMSETTNPLLANTLPAAARPDPPINPDAPRLIPPVTRGKHSTRADTPAYPPDRQHPRADALKPHPGGRGREPDRGEYAPPAERAEPKGRQRAPNEVTARDVARDAALSHFPHSPLSLYAPKIAQKQQNRRHRIYLFVLEMHDV